jgi:hypothetical protein
MRMGRTAACWTRHFVAAQYEQMAIAPEIIQAEQRVSSAKRDACPEFLLAITKLLFADTCLFARDRRKTA